MESDANNVGAGTSDPRLGGETPPPADPPAGQDPITPPPPADPLAGQDPNISPPAPPSDFTIPEEYKEAGWAGKIKSIEELWKAHANAQSLIGKKTVGVPDENSTDEEWVEFNKKMSPEGTEYQFTEDTPDEDKSFFNETLSKNGINKRAGDALLKAYNEHYSAKLEEMRDKGKFWEMAKERFKDDDQDTLKSSYDTIKEYSSEADHAVISSLTNNQMLSVTAVINGVIKAYGVSPGSKLNDGKTSSGQGVPSKERGLELSKQLIEGQKNGMPAQEQNRLMNEIAKENGI